MKIVEIRAIELFVLISAILIGRYLLPWLKAHMELSKLTLILSYALSYVKCAEVIYSGDERGNEKLRYVSAQLAKKAFELGIEMDDKDIRALIEQAVLAMKEEQKDVF